MKKKEKRKKKNLITRQIKVQRKEQTSKCFSRKTTMLKTKRTHHDDGKGNEHVTLKYKLALFIEQFLLK